MGEDSHRRLLTQCKFVCESLVESQAIVRSRLVPGSGSTIQTVEHFLVVSVVFVRSPTPNLVLPWPKHRAYPSTSSVYSSPASVHPLIPFSKAMLFSFELPRAAHLSLNQPAARVTRPREEPVRPNASAVCLKPTTVEDGQKHASAIAQVVQRVEAVMQRLGWEIQ